MCVCRSAAATPCRRSEGGIALALLNDRVRIGLWVDSLQLGVKAGLQTLAALGGQAAGLDAFGPEIAPRTLGATGRRGLAQFLRSRGLALTALGADVGGRRLADNQYLDANLSRLREALQLASDLGAHFLVVPAGHIPAKEDSSAGVLAEAAKALSNAAASFGVRVCWQAGNEAAEVLRAFLEKHDSGEALALEFNPAAFVMRGHETLQALQHLSVRLALVRATDQYRGGAEAPFGQGDVRWGELLIALSGLPGSAPLDLLASSERAGSRVEALSAAVKRLQALRLNPLS